MKNALGTINTYKEEHKIEVDHLIKISFEPLREIYVISNTNSVKTLDFKTLVYQIEDIIVGTISYYYEDDKVRIFRLAVDPSFRGRGIAKSLLNYLEKSLISTKYNKIGLYTIKETGNGELFIKFGFRIISEDIATLATSPLGYPVIELDMVKNRSLAR
ncbi:MAG: GNAT family N-acetyltransferase [Spirochaetaceae bacterium]